MGTDHSGHWQRSPNMKFLLVALCVCTAYASLIHKPHIIDGNDATLGQFPWQLSLENTGSHSCGAVIIEPTNFALTAGHCVSGSEPSDFQVHYGAIRKGDPGNRMNVIDIAVHPQYGNPDIEANNPYDAAVLTLESAIPVDGKNVQSITRAAEADGDLAGRKDCQLSGWGSTGPVIGGNPEVLQFKTINVLSNGDCANKWGPGYIHESHICVEDPTDPDGDGGSACFGDSGGPMNCPKGSGQILAGLTSWGIATCRGQPGVYTRVSKVKAFVDGVTGGK